jgi:hypothetical protein
MGDKIFTAISILIYLLGLGGLIYALLVIFRFIQI